MIVTVPFALKFVDALYTAGALPVPLRALYDSLAIGATRAHPNATSAPPRSSRPAVRSRRPWSRAIFPPSGIQLGARYDGSPIVVSDGTAPPADDPWRYQPTACPGGRAPHLFFPDQSSLFDHLGTGFTLLHLHSEHDTEAMACAAEDRRIPFKTLKVEQAEGRELYECDLALIRPDQHVAWRGNSLPDDCGDLLARVTGW